MQFATLRTRTLTRFRDINGLIVTTTTVGQHINAAYRHFLVAGRWPFLITTHNTIASTHLVPLPVEVISGIEQVFDVTNDRMLQPMPANLKWRFDMFLNAQESGTPAMYRVMGPDLYLVPTPSEATTLQIFYFREPLELVNATDEPEIPDRYEEALVVGALAKMYRDDENYTAAREAQAEFEAIIQQAREELILGDVSSLRNFITKGGEGNGAAGSGGAGSESSPSSLGLGEPTLR